MDPKQKTNKCPVAARKFVVNPLTRRRFVSQALLPVFGLAWVLTAASVTAQPPLGEADTEFTGAPNDLVPNHQLFVMEQLAKHKFEPGFVQALNLSEETWSDLVPIIDQFNEKQSRLVKEYSLALQDLDALNLSPDEKEEKTHYLRMDNREKRLMLVGEYWSNLGEITLPHEMLQIQTVAVQRQLAEVVMMRVSGAAGLLGHRLGLTDAEKTKFEEEYEKICREYSSKLIELRKNSINQILDSLPLDARKKVDELIGEVYLEGHDRVP
jgi:hypothetical protein